MLCINATSNFALKGLFAQKTAIGPSGAAIAIAFLAVNFAATCALVHICTGWQHIGLTLRGSLRSALILAPMFAGIIFFTPWGGDALHPWFLVAACFASLNAGIGEELIVRGMMQHMLGGLRYPWLSVVGGSCFFGLSHLGNIFLGVLIQAVLVQVVATAIIGLSWAVARAISGTLIPGMIAHFLFDYSPSFSSSHGTFLLGTSLGLGPGFIELMYAPIALLGYWL